MSTLEFGRVKHIPLRFQLIVHGYLRISQSLLAKDDDPITIIPAIIFHICALFYYDFDEWDTNSIGKGLMFDENNPDIVKYKTIAHCPAYNSAYLKRVCNSEEGDVYHWKFRLLNCDAVWNLIGIWKVTKDGIPPSGYFTYGTNAGYALCLQRGQLVDRNGGGGTGAEYSCECAVNDIIEMHLDFELMELRYTINGKDYGKAFDVDPGRYRAAICLQKEKGSMELLTE